MPRIPLRFIVAAIAAGGLAAGCGGQWEPQPGEFDAPPAQPTVAAETTVEPPRESGTAAPSTPAPQQEALTAPTETQGTPIGGGGLLGEQLTAIRIQNELGENLGRSDAAAQATGRQARQAVQSLGQAYSERADEILDDQ